MELSSSRENTRVEKQPITSQVAVQSVDRHKNVPVLRKWSFCVNFMMHSVSCSSVMAFAGRILPQVDIKMPSQINVSLIPQQLSI